MKKFSLEEALQLGVSAHKEGNVGEADRYYTAILKARPDHPDANHNMGVLGVSVGKAEEALPFFRKSLKVNPSVVQFWLSYIDTLIKLRRFEEGLEALNQGKGHGIDENLLRPLEQQLTDALEHKHTANDAIVDPDKKELDELQLLYTQNKFQEALKLAEALKKDFPNSPYVYFYAGVNHLSLSQLEEAISSFLTAINIHPNFPNAYNNLGDSFFKLNKNHDAICNFQKALVLRPAYSFAFNNLARTLLETQKYSQAISYFQRALIVTPDLDQASFNLAEALSCIRPTEYSQTLSNLYSRVSSAGPIFLPKILGDPIIKLLKLHPIIKRAIHSENVEELIKLFSELEDIPLFLKLLELGPIADLEIEAFIKKIRRIFLLNRQSSLNEQFLRLKCSIALQCFLNEFIYDVDRQEEQAIEELEKKLIVQSKSQKLLEEHDVVCLASYNTLNSYSWADSVTTSACMDKVLKSQVTDIRQELALKPTIPQLKDIKNATSLAVRGQYEENPYPRWVTTRLEPLALTLPQLVSKLRLNGVREKIKFSDTPSILVAGCGTGQHALATATRFQNCEVTAVDLSLSSLSYAKRKTDEFGVKNIKYIQADILDLASLKQKFDVIESVGVLHHMADPLAGWKILTNLLNPGGLIKIGLYSQSARTNITWFRNLNRQQDFSSTRRSLVGMREQIINQADPRCENLIKATDFFSLSNFRDLLFHVEEHQFTLAQIKKILKELKLNFVGFELGDVRMEVLFKTSYPQPNAIYDLDRWHEFEVDNPNFFSGMYQFWCQKTF